MNAIVESAIAIGLPVFPCRPDKRPATPHGFKDAVRDPDAVRDLWNRHPGVLIGVPTGAVSGIAVLDIDAKGRPWLHEFNARLPQTRRHRTRSGGLHLLFQHAPGLRCSASAIAPGVDVRADGGYVIFWPATGLPILNDAPPAPWPSWLAVVPNRTEIARANSPIVPDERSIHKIVRAVATAPEGKRNELLFWAACRFGERIRSRLFDESAALAILREAGQRAGLPESEAVRTALSGLRIGGAR